MGGANILLWGAWAQVVCVEAGMHLPWQAHRRQAPVSHCLLRKALLVGVPLFAPA